MNEKDLAIECLTATYERIIKRLWILCIVIFIVSSAIIGYMFYYNSQFEVVETHEITQENADGVNNYIGNDGDIANGEAND